MKPRSVPLFRPISRETVGALFEAALVQWDQKRPGAWLDTLEGFTRLIEAELQSQVFSIAHRRATRKDG